MWKERTSIVMCGELVFKSIQVKMCGRNKYCYILQNNVLNLLNTYKYVERINRYCYVNFEQNFESKKQCSYANILICLLHIAMSLIKCYVSVS